MQTAIKGSKIYFDVHVQCLALRLLEVKNYNFYTLQLSRLRSAVSGLALSDKVCAMRLMMQYLQELQTDILMAMTNSFTHHSEQVICLYSQICHYSPLYHPFL